MKEILAVFLGGGLGSLTRYGLGKWIDSWHNSYFPYGTFIVNVAACLILGFVLGFADSKHLISPVTKLFWAVGFCGGFSTFSTFSNESLGLLQQGHYTSLVIYTVASVVICVLATFGGLALSKIV